MRDKCKIINVQQNYKAVLCKCHGLFDNSPVMITVKSWLKYFVQYNKILHLFKLLSRIMAHYSHVIYACYQNMLQNLFSSCNTPQINLLSGYIHPKEQPAVFIP